MLKKFNEFFGQNDKKIEEEELLNFLDKKARQKFDRENFGELVNRVYEKHEELTPENFAKVYFEAFEVLQIKTDHTMTDLNNIDKALQLTRNERETMLTLEITDLKLTSSAETNYFISFDVTKNCSLNFYNLNGERDYIFLPGKFVEKEEPLRVTLMLLNSKIIDSVNLNIRQEVRRGKTKVVFADGSELGFSLLVHEIRPEDSRNALNARKAELQEYEVHTTTKRTQLIETFADVFSEGVDIGNKRDKLSPIFITSCALSLGMFLAALFLNFTRSTFVDIFVAIAFFGSIYVWRNFNVFFAIKLIGILVVSIVIDVIWEIIKLMNFNQKYEAQVKVMRLWGFVLSAVLILVKIALLYFYWRLSKEDHLHGFLGLNEEMSLDEISAGEFIGKGRK